MIYVCEPQCKKGSHESFNSGFLHGLKAIDNEICFYAEKTHLQYIKSYLLLRGQNTEHIIYNKINFPDNIYNFMQIFSYYKIFSNILNQVSKDDKLLFLSITPMALFVLYNLQKKQKYKNIIFNIVLHGEIEELYPKVSLETLTVENQDENIKNHTQKSISLLQRISGKPINYLIKRTIKGTWHFLYRSINNIINNTMSNTVKSLDKLNKTIFTYKSFLSNNKDLSSFNFIVLSKHILNNLHIDNTTFKMKLCYLPCIFPSITIKIINDYPKFAIFGYGTDNGLFEKFLEQLNILNPSKKYEIRLISVRRYPDIDKYMNITFNEKDFIPRHEYEKLAEDIDYFLNFYDSSQYKLSCSGSIIEAIMHRKPVIYIGNECYDSFNSLAGPIGIRAGNAKNFAEIVFDIIENWPCDLRRINEFKKNIEDVTNIINLTTQLKNDKSIIA